MSRFCSIISALQGFLAGICHIQTRTSSVPHKEKALNTFLRNIFIFQSLRPRCCKKAAERTGIVRLKESKVAFLDKICYYLGCSDVGGLFRTGGAHL